MGSMKLSKGLMARKSNKSTIIIGEKNLIMFKNHSLHTRKNWEQEAESGK